MSGNIKWDESCVSYKLTFLVDGKILLSFEIQRKKKFTATPEALSLFVILNYRLQAYMGAFFLKPSDQNFGTRINKIIRSPIAKRCKRQAFFRIFLS